MDFYDARNRAFSQQVPYGNGCGQREDYNCPKHYENVPYYPNPQEPPQMSIKPQLLDICKELLESQKRQRMELDYLEKHCETNKKMLLILEKLKLVDEENKKLKNRVEQLEKCSSQPEDYPREQCNAILVEDQIHASLKDRDNALMPLMTKLSEDQVKMDERMLKKLDNTIGMIGVLETRNKKLEDQMWENTKQAFMVQEKTNKRTESLAKKIEALEEENQKLRDQVGEMKKHVNQPDHPPKEQWNAIYEEGKPMEEVHKCEFCESDSEFCRDDGDLWFSEYESFGEDYDVPHNLAMKFDLGACETQELPSPKEFEEKKKLKLTRASVPKAPLQQISTKPKDAMGITLKSGKTYEPPSLKPQAKANPKEIEKRKGKEKEKIAKKNSEAIESEKEEPYKGYPLVPFPQRLKKISKIDTEFGKFLKVLKQLTVTIPFMDLVKSAPEYGKFIKEILSNKRTIEEVDSCSLSHECSALLSPKKTTKVKDPGKFTIPCSIGDRFFEQPLADLGASVNIMPYDVYKKLGLKEMQATSMVLHLADGSTKKPHGVIENVPVKVDKFYIPCDFVVLDVSNNVDSPLIFGRPFLATARARIEVASGKLTLEICDEIVEVVSLAKLEVASCDSVEILPLKVGKASKNGNTSRENDQEMPIKAKKLTKKMLKRLCDSSSSSSFAMQDLKSHSKIGSKSSRTKSLEGENSSNWEAINKSTLAESKDPG